MASTTEMQRVHIADIRPYENNAKIHGREQLEKLKASMPSAVVVNVMGANHKRMHHRVKWENCVPEILSERWKK